MRYSVAVSAPLHRSYPAPFQGGIPEGIMWAQKLGFDAVELHLKKANDVDATEVLEICNRIGMSVSGISTGMGYTIDGLSLIEDDANKRDAAVIRLVEHIDLASILSCSVIIGLMRGIIPDESRREVYLNRFAGSITQLLRHAEKKRVALLIEAINRFQTNYFLNVPETVEFINRFNHPLLKVHIDTFHMNIEDHDMAQAVRYSRHHLGYVHYSENNRSTPGSGHIDFKMLTNTLISVGYQGYISLEFAPEADSTISTEACLRYLRSMEEVLGDLPF